MKSSINRDNIPQELRDLPKWVVWKLVDRPGQKKPAKLLFDPRTGQAAKANDPQTWTDFDTAFDAYQRGGWAGIGFVFDTSDDILGIDLDDCCDTGLEVIQPWAEEIVDRLESYWEVSPSGTGLHIFLRGKIPGDRMRSGKFEIYQNGRFFTVTGNVLNGSPTAVNERQTELNEIYSKIFPPKTDTPPRTTTPSEPIDVSDGVLLDKMFSSKPETQKLWVGDLSQHGGDHSAADLALCSHLAFWTNRDPVRMDRLFRESQLCRPKWDEKRGEKTYGEMTIQKALDGCSDGYTPSQRGGRQEQETFFEDPNLKPPSERFNLTDMGNGERLIRQWGTDLRYCHPWDRWVVWNGRQWKPDDMAAVYRMARQTVRSIYQEASSEANEEERKRLASHAMKCESEARTKSMEWFGRSEEGIPILPEDLDKDPWLLNCQNGTLDLQNGKLREHRREDFITKLCPVDYEPSAKCPLWDAFLNRIMDNKPELINFLQRMAGYCLTGSVREQKLFLLHGGGSNGKSTFLNTLLAVLGKDFSKQLDPDLFLWKRDSAHPTGLADLYGLRMAVSIEIEEGKRLAEVMMKQLTGGDTIAARKMRQDFFNFEPTHKILLAANHRPQVFGTDLAVWRRIDLIPFNVTISENERDLDLLNKLKAESAGILAWMVRGCLEWQRIGLKEPNDVKAATKTYREDEDILADFLSDECVINSVATVLSSKLKSAYFEWAKRNGEPTLGTRAFAHRLQERGFITKKPGGTQTWFGIGLLEKKQDKETT